MKALIALALLLAASSAWSETDYSRFICTVDESGPASVFYCSHLDTGESFTQSVSPIEQSEIVATMKESGIQFTEMLDYIARVSGQALIAIREAGSQVSSCFKHVQYTVNEFNSLPTNHPTIVRVKELASVLKEAGVCELPIYSSVNRDPFNLGIQNNDDLLAHFLCIANTESTFGRGRDNIGMGGRGPWGIHPTEHDGRGEICDDLNPIARLPSGVEDRNGARYENRPARLANAKCALRLYAKKEGLRDWGQSNGSWGSNRRCSKAQRDRFHFTGFLKADACCSQQCKNKATGSTNL
jgi:hypothetical protein